MDNENVIEINLKMRLFQVFRKEYFGIVEGFMEFLLLIANSKAGSCFFILTTNSVRNGLSKCQKYPLLAFQSDNPKRSSVHY